MVSSSGLILFYSDKHYQPWTFHPHQLTGTLKVVLPYLYQGPTYFTLESWFLEPSFLKLMFRRIQFKPGFLSLVNRCKFTATPDCSNLPIMLNQFLFSHRVVRKIRRGFIVFHDKVTYGSNPLYKDFVAATSLFLETTNRTFLRVSFSGGRSSVIWANVNIV